MLYFFRLLSCFMYMYDIYGEWAVALALCRFRDEIGFGLAEVSRPQVFSVGRVLVTQARGFVVELLPLRSTGMRYPDPE